MPTRIESLGRSEASKEKNRIVKETLKGMFGQEAQKAWREYDGPVGVKAPAKKFDPNDPKEKFNPKYCQCPFPKIGLPIRDIGDYVEHPGERCSYHVDSKGREAPFEAAAHADLHFDWWYEQNKVVENGVERPPERTWPITLPQWSKDGPMSPEDKLRKKMREKMEQEMREQEDKKEVEEAKMTFEESRRAGKPPKS